MRDTRRRKSTGFELKGINTEDKDISENLNG